MLVFFLGIDGVFKLDYWTPNAFSDCYPDPVL